MTRRLSKPHLISSAKLTRLSEENYQLRLRRGLAADAPIPGDTIYLNSPAEANAFLAAEGFISDEPGNNNSQELSWTAEGNTQTALITHRWRELTVDDMLSWDMESEDLVELSSYILIQLEKAQSILMRSPAVEGGLALIRAQLSTGEPELPEPSKSAVGDIDAIGQALEFLRRAGTGITAINDDLSDRLLVGDLQQNRVFAHQLPVHADAFEVYAALAANLITAQDPTNSVIRNMRVIRRTNANTLLATAVVKNPDHGLPPISSGELGFVAKHQERVEWGSVTFEVAFVRAPNETLRTIICSQHLGYDENYPAFLTELAAITQGNRNPHADYSNWLAGKAKPLELIKLPAT